MIDILTDYSLITPNRVKERELFLSNDKSMVWF